MSGFKPDILSDPHSVTRAAREGLWDDVVESLRVNNALFEQDFAAGILHEAVIQKNLAAAKNLVLLGIPPQDRSLHVAAANGCAGICALLAPRVHARERVVAATDAATEGFTDVVAALIASGFEDNLFLPRLIALVSEATQKIPTREEGVVPAVMLMVREGKPTADGTRRLLDQAITIKNLPLALALRDYAQEACGESLCTKMLGWTLANAARNNHGTSVDMALGLGAELGANDHQPFRLSETSADARAALLKWYARNAENFSVSRAPTTLAKISGLLEDQFAKDGWLESAIIRATKKDADFLEIMSAFEKGEKKFDPAQLLRDRDCFGNTVIDLLGARGKLGLLFKSPVWADHADGLAAFFEKNVAPVYRPQVNIDSIRSAFCARRNRRLLGKSPHASKWKL